MANERTFRDALREISPRWLISGLGEKILYSFGLLFDYLAEWVAEAVRRRLPQDGSNDALGRIGVDRRMPRGRDETPDNYAARLVGWLDAHRTRGGPYALLAQVAAHYRTAPFDMRLLYALGRVFTMAAPYTAPITRTDITTPVTDLVHWSRWWLIYTWPDALNPDGIWSDPGVYDDGGVWDSDLSAADVADLRLIPFGWNAAHAIGALALVPPGSAFLGMSISAWGDPSTWTLPDALPIGLDA